MRLQKQFWKITSALALLSFLGCAGGSRGTGLKTVVNGGDKLESRSEIPRLLELFQDSKTARCRLADAPGNALFVLARTGIAAVEYNDKKICILKLRNPDEQVVVEFSGPLGRTMRISARDTQGKVVWSRRSATGQDLFLGSEIPTGGAVEVQAGKTELLPVARIEVQTK